MTSDAHKTFFGTFLSELRVSRGFANINEYLRHYPVPISSVHYRHLESGNRKVSVDSAKELCETLQADSKVFYYNLLRDWLPEEFMAHFDSLSKSREHMQEAYQKAILQASDSQILYPSTEACDYLNDHFELIPLLWFVYSMQVVNLEQIRQVAKLNGIAEPVEQVMHEFEKLGLIQIESVQPNEIVVRRLKASISFMHDKLGTRILLHETNRSLGHYSEARNPLLKDSILIYSLMSLSAENRQIIFSRIQDFIRAAHETIQESADVQSEKLDPVFYSFVYAPRHQYRLGDDDDGVS